MFGHRGPSFALSELVGSRVDEARAKGEADGFEVQVVDLEGHGAVTLDLRPNRIRLYVRRGKVEDATRG
ncbi:Potato inhibitor I family protein [Amycolatopsis lurida]|uniref:Uncharacterized protein n=1 Tax=Amycolatopsis lurida NRRL 2430 TaxID=1460371 RepID=A0A2P2FMC5_AMYLU|nr:hypothetical protein [Amycolatopsis lurida]KFU77875.1 hypothetical protein BB31_28605 [Amycolatopsis lurida NRRL 2430]SEC71160.1 Potato inhibitor I family protein [Amycolatopsis lurida]